MHYIITQLITTEQDHDFYLVGQTEDRKRAAAIAAAAYQKFRPDASAQNLAMITEWLEFRQEYSFRRDKEHRIQLRITPLDTDQPENAVKLFSLSATASNDDALLQAISARLAEGHTTAESDGQGHCRVLRKD